MPLQETSGNVTTDAYGGGVAAVPQYIEDVFSTYLYAGSNSSQTITNGINLSTYGGLVWTKVRTTTYPHCLTDTIRGGNKQLFSNTTDVSTTSSPAEISSFNTTGYTLAGGTVENVAGQNFVGWTFREQPKFFDVVTWTGNNADGRFISHNLGSTPGMVIIKNLTSPYNWVVWHKDLANPSKYLVLNSTAATATDIYGPFGSYSAGFTTNASCFTSTGFYVAADARSNLASNDYVAYIFAHDAGGFGLTGTDNVISCGSFADSSSINVNLGYEPQWIMVKAVTSSSQPWGMYDVMRRQSNTGTSRIQPNASDAEQYMGQGLLVPTATGFTSSAINTGAGESIIYIAIRRGPMKVPTDATKVFAPVTYTSDNTNNRLITTGILTDGVFARYRNAVTSTGVTVGNRLTGDNFLGTALTSAEFTSANGFSTPTAGYGNGFSAMNGFGVGTNASALLNYGTIYNAVAYSMQRAPSFFDVVCFNGSDSDFNMPHNLGVVPELIIFKRRSSTGAWFVLSSYYPTGFGAPNNNYFTRLNLDSALAGPGAFFSGTITSTNVPMAGAANYTAGQTGVAYLFASATGVSKVGTYTGNGTTQTINCGFTGGARFVLIKRTDATGDWYVYDTARGMTTLTDPYLLVNDVNAEVATLGSVTTVSTGFALNSSILAAINVSGGSYIFLAIA